MIIGIGGGKTATVTEPTRANFSDNVRGAIEYAIAHVVYKALEIMGGALGAFTAGLGVQFLDRIEPSLVKYSRPLIDLLLAQPGMPAQYVTFLTQLKTPTDAGATGILMGFASQAGGQMAGSVFDVLLQPVVSALRTATRPSVAPPGDMIGIRRRGVLDPNESARHLKASGYTDGVLDAYADYLRPRAGVDDLYGSVLRGHSTMGAVTAELSKQGYTNSDINIFTGNLERQLGVEELMTARFRGLKTDDQVKGGLRALGYTEADLPTIMTIGQGMPGASDIVRLAVREAFTDSVASKYGYDNDYPAAFTTYMQQAGYTPQWARYYWRAKWELPSPSMGYDMLHRGLIDAPGLDELLRVLDYPSYWRSKLTAMSYSPLTRVDVRRMYKMGVVKRERVKLTYQQLGYTPADAELLTRFTELTYPPDSEDPVAAKRDLTANVVTESYKKHLIDHATAVTMLLGLGYDVQEATFLLNLADAQGQVDSTPDYSSEHVRDMIALTERAYLQGSVDHAQAVGAFGGIGLTTPEVTIRMAILDAVQTEHQTEAQTNAIGDAYVSGAMTYQDVIARLGALHIAAGAQAKLLAKWDVTKVTRSRRLTEAQYRNAFDLEQITLAEYKEAMRGLGYSEKDATILAEQADWYNTHLPAK